MADRITGKRLQISAAAWFLFLAACAPTPSTVAPPNAASRSVDAASYQEMSDLSGENKAITDLVERLRISCGLPDFSPAPMPELVASGLMPPAGEFQGHDLLALANGEECLRSRIVTAFEASEGEAICRRQPRVELFIKCIIEGAYKARIARNLSINYLTAEMIWGERDEPMQAINDVLFRQSLHKCQRRSQWEANNCAEDFWLPALEIDRSDISQCPGGALRTTCITKAGIARFVNDKLIYIF